ncbi:craniofacial development protein 2-like [Anoplophora glabripennis]|uniref:craniofacial development protein 2-like n=1 Tax=Anoplophora glabripennis TaxID=217634 RepID=UPI000873D385|nr:craniofacial development protein 2-like [Anoplophora glabripennis]
MRRYNVDILALQETKQKGKTITEVEDHTFFNSGVENRRLGVGFIVNNRFKNEVIEFEGVSDRICRIRIKGQFRKINIINVHAPSEEKDLEIKVKFYEDLDRILGRLPRFDVKYVIGAMNAKVGREEEYREVTGGKSRHAISNDNGKRLIEFALESNMKIVSTAFDHKNIHKETWIAPNGETRNQIYHVLIERKHAKDVTDVRSYRGADSYTDHILVIIEMRQERPFEKKICEKGRAGEI